MGFELLLITKNVPNVFTFQYKFCLEFLEAGKLNSSAARSWTPPCHQLMLNRREAGDRCHFRMRIAAGQSWPQRWILPCRWVVSRNSWSIACATHWSSPFICSTFASSKELTGIPFVPPSCFGRLSSLMTTTYSRPYSTSSDPMTVIPVLHEVPTPPLPPMMLRWSLHLHDLTIGLASSRRPRWWARMHDSREFR